MIAWKTTCAWIAVASLLPNAAQAAIPALNDDFASSALLGGDYLEATSNNSTASAELGEPDHAGLSAGASLWWRWTAPTNGWVALNSTPSAFTPCFAVYRGATLTNLNLVAFSPVKCAEQGWGVHPSLSQSEIFRVSAGEIYHLAFDSPRSAYGDYDPTNAPRGQIRFSLVFSSLEITHPPHGATYFTDSAVPVSIDVGGATGILEGVTLELDGQPVRDAKFALSPLLLANLQPGPHTLRARASDINGHERFSPPVQIHVRPASDDFSRALSLTGANLTWTGNTYYATMESGEPSHPSGHDGFTVWYRWTAPAEGVVRIAIPTGGGVAVTIFRGDSVTDLELVTANPLQYGLIIPPGPLYNFLCFATQASESYAIQVSSRRSVPMPLVPSGPCDAPWYGGYPFALQLEFALHPIGTLHLDFNRGLLPWTTDSVLCFFAARRDGRFVLESSPNLVHWDEAARGRATGAMEVIVVPAHLAEAARFFRVRLDRGTPVIP